MTIAIVGAGIAGLACAEGLAAAGHDVHLFDKGRRPGGRMSSRAIATAAGEAQFDHGAQYFSVRDPRFAARVARWRDEGLAAPWPAGGGDAYVGTPAMRAPVAAMAAALPVQWSAPVTGLRTTPGGGWHALGVGRDAARYDALVVAIPAEQAAALLGPIAPDWAARAAAAVSEPCWTVMAAFRDHLAIEADVLRPGGAIGWAARNTSKPGRGGPESWVIQAGPAWSRDHLEDTPEAVVPALLAAFAAVVDAASAAILPAPLVAAAHRWRYARAGTAPDGPVWNPKTGLGLCGDWLRGPRVEAAWLSGDALAGAMAGAPTTRS